MIPPNFSTSKTQNRGQKTPRAAVGRLQNHEGIRPTEAGANPEEALPPVQASVNTALDDRYREYAQFFPHRERIVHLVTSEGAKPPLENLFVSQTHPHSSYSCSSGDAHSPGSGRGPGIARFVDNGTALGPSKLSIQARLCGNKDGNSRDNFGIPRQRSPQP